MIGDNRFVFIVPMYNASQTLQRMLHSVCGQSYENWKIVLIDDVSDRHEILSCKYILNGFRNLVPRENIEIIWNDEKKWEVANVLEGLKGCKLDDIVCRLDADDWLVDLDALAIINEAYKQLDCDILWTAHRWGFSDKNISAPLPADTNPYIHPWVTSHLKTFRYNLISGINDENYRGSDGEYIRRCGDQAFYLPALYKAKKRVFLPRVMYHYTINDVPETYQTDDAKFQRDEALFLRRRGFVE